MELSKRIEKAKSMLKEVYVIQLNENSYVCRLNGDTTYYLKSAKKFKTEEEAQKTLDDFNWRYNNNHKVIKVYRNNFETVMRKVLNSESVRFNSWQSGEKISIHFLYTQLCEIEIYDFILNAPTLIEDVITKCMQQIETITKYKQKYDVFENEMIETFPSLTDENEHYDTMDFHGNKGAFVRLHHREITVPFDKLTIDGFKECYNKMLLQEIKKGEEVIKEEKELINHLQGMILI